MDTQTLRNKVLEFISYEKAYDATGVYPAKSNGIERTEYENGWNACHKSILEKAIKIDKFLESVPNKHKEFVEDLLIDEVAMLHIDGDVITLFIICSDLFYWGCADAEDFIYDDIPDFIKAKQDCPKHYDSLWCCRKRGMRPQKPCYRNFTEEEKQLFDACGPERNE